MRRVVLFLTTSAAVLVLAWWVAHLPGTVALSGFGYSVETTSPIAAQRARDASRAGGEEAGIGDRVWQRVRALVTVKEGETVLLGSPAATTLGLAGEKLAAGDLAGSVAALEGLDPGAAAEMAAWRGQAEALLAARAALSKMAAE